jgi:glycolate oxidase iron-sulfur subunit
MLKDYGHLLRDAPDLADMLAVVAPRVRDVCEFLAEDGNLALAAAGHLGCRIASHTPCSLRHGQRLAAPPRVLLREAGFDVVDAPDDGTCCGSAGTYNLLQPALAEALGRQKAACLEITGADIVATGNLGCAMQIARFSTLPVVHTVELLDWAGGGPRPKAIGAAQQKQHRPG